jgi:alkylhydroperoxidase/carboxymuconolactone decarboxylase family protein YurZ
MKKSLPQSVIKFESKYPEIWKAFAALGEKCHETGPLNEKTRRLVKLRIAIAARHEGAVSLSNCVAIAKRPEVLPKLPVRCLLRQVLALKNGAPLSCPRFSVDRRFP